MTDRQKITWGFGLWGASACLAGATLANGFPIATIVLFGLSCWAHHRASELLRSSGVE